MLKLFLFLIICACIPLVFSWRGLILGPGQWLVQSLELCENPEQYEFLDGASVSRQKINRTHDCFDINVVIPRLVNNSYAVKIDVYKLVDGGFKYFQTFADDCACCYLMRHAEKNVKRAFALAHVEPADCPIQPQYLQLKNFVMDYRELPLHGVYGTFEAFVYFLYEKKKILCARIVLNFDQRRSDNSGEDDADYDLL